MYTFLCYKADESEEIIFKLPRKIHSNFYSNLLLQALVGKVVT